MSRPSELSVLSQVLAHVRILIVTGHPLPEGLRSFGEKLRRDPAGVLALELAGCLEGGESLSAAVERCRPGISAMAITLLRSGETGENLAQAIESLVEFQQGETRLLARIDAATLYPRLISFSALVIVMPVLAWCVRTNATIGLGYRPAPSLPRLQDALGAIDLIGVVGWLGAAFAWVVLAVPRMLLWPYQLGPWFPLVLAIGLWVLLFRPIGPVGGLAAWIVERLRVIGPALRNARAASFSTSLGLLLKGGIPLDRAVALAGEFSPDGPTRRRFAALERMLKEGRTLSEALTGCTLFPASLVWFAAIGERSERLETSLLEAGRYYRGEAEYLTEFLVQVLEPVTLVILGLVIGSVVVSTYLPLIQMLDSI